MVNKFQIRRRARGLRPFGFILRFGRRPGIGYLESGALFFSEKPFASLGRSTNAELGMRNGWERLAICLVLVKAFGGGRKTAVKITAY